MKKQKVSSVRSAETVVADADHLLASCDVKPTSNALKRGNKFAAKRNAKIPVASGIATDILGNQDRDNLPAFTTLRGPTKRPSCLSPRDMAAQLVKLYGGQCLTQDKISIVKGAEAYKFKCANGHTFFKLISELRESYSISSASSDDLDTMSATQSSQDTCCWCLKCETIFKTSERLAKQSGFKLIGEMYGTSLAFNCSKIASEPHLNNIAISRPLPASFRCIKCSKIGRDAEK